MDIKDYLTDNELFEFALYLKRVCFEDVCIRSEGHGQEQKENAYNTLEVIGKVQKFLKDLGYNPR